VLVNPLNLYPGKKDAYPTSKKWKKARKRGKFNGSLMPFLRGRLAQLGERSVRKEMTPLMRKALILREMSIIPTTYA